MTLDLDGAIAHAKEKAKELYDEAMFVHANPNDEKLDACIECANEHQQLAEWLTELQERREADRWIPVSERLPKNAFIGCLVTVYETDKRTGDEYEAVLPYSVGYDGETWNDIDGEVIPFEVIAWKPLPEPYKESEAEV